MKKILFLWLSVLCTNFLWSQTIVTGPSSVEVGINYTYDFAFKPTTTSSFTIPTGTSYYLVKASYISAGNSNMNNSGNFAYDDTSQQFVHQAINSTAIRNFPIKWEDNTNQTISIINISQHIEFYDSNGGYLSAHIFADSFTVTVNRILSPSINTPVILDCCSNPVSFTASNYGAANSFSWTVTGGTYTGNGATISVTPNPAGSVSVSCTVSRSSGLPSYTRTGGVTVSRTARSASLINPATGTIYGFPAYICDGSSQNLSVLQQCGFASVVWTAPNCAITGQNTSNATITPSSSIAPGSIISVYATITFTGGCVITTPAKSFTIYEAATPQIPSGTLSFTSQSGNVCAPGYWIAHFTPSASSPFVNGQIIIDPPTIIPGKGTGPYSFDVCYMNLCNGQQTCKTISRNTPVPCTSKMIDQEELKLSISPNPTSGNLKITLPEALSGTYIILSQNGSVIMENEFKNSSELYIQLSGKIKSGIYILKVISETNSFTEKIILNR
ncbi:MAG: T9SS type A sorting domain-containing protein [Flavobacterium sp.]